MILGTRVVIVGNSGSGKSTPARAIGLRAGTPVFDLAAIWFAAAMAPALSAIVAATIHL